MVAAPLPLDEPARLAALRATALLDTPAEAIFDDLAALAATLCDAPMAAITLVDEHRQWFKARVGFTTTETPRNLSFCAHAIASAGDLLVVPDARQDPRFAGHPAVQGEPPTRFYAGCPLRTRDGHAIGTLCVFAHEPRGLTDTQRQSLLRLARVATGHIAARLPRAAEHSAEVRSLQLFERNPLPMWIYDRETLRFLAVNDAAVSRYGYTRGEFLRMTVRDIRPPETIAEFEERLPAIGAGLIQNGRSRHRWRDGSARTVEIFSHGLDFLGRPARLVLANDITEQEKALLALRASEGRFRTLSESAPIGVFEGDAHGNCTYCNPALARIVGIAPEQFHGRNWANFIHPDDRAHIVEVVQRHCAQGTPTHWEHRLLLPGGEIRWVRAHSAPQTFGPDGNATSFVGTVEDITEQHLAAASLRESEERFRKLHLLSPDGLYTAYDNRITLVNPAFCRMMGVHDSSQLIGRNVFDLLRPEDHAIVLERRAMLDRGDPLAPLALHFLRADGSVLEAEVLTVGLDAPPHRHWQVILRDLTARKAAERALRDSEERFKLVARAVSDVLWDWDFHANTLWWSDGFLTAFGYEPHEVGTGIESWTTRLHEEDRDRVLQGIHRAIERGDPIWTCEYRFRRSDGSYAYVQDRGLVMRDADGRPVRMVGGMTDLTERKKLETQYLRAQRMESLGTLAGGIAHDLNNVLAPILMGLELLRAFTANDAECQRLITTLESSARRGAGLVRQVLSFARGVEGERRSLDLSVVVHEMARIARETFPRTILIEEHVAENLRPVLGDATQLHQVLLNLSVNARDAMPHGGLLRIFAENVEIPGPVIFPGMNPGPHVRLRVADTGTGIPAEIRERIFEPFFTTKEVGRGTGLGLSTVHAIVKSHQGIVHVDSEPGRGSTFSVYLPVNTTNEPPSDAAELTPLPHGRGETVLVVDDEEPIRKISQNTLEGFGYRVLVAAHGAEALAIFAEKSSELAAVVTDMVMPVMDGPAMIAAMLKIKPDLRVIAMTGMDSTKQGAVTRALVRDLILKPFTAETLLRTLRRVLDA